MNKILKDRRGVALVVALMMMLILMSLTGAGLIVSGINLKTTSNVETSTAALHAADAGLQHALAVIPVGPTFSYSTETVLLNNVSFGAGGYSYTVKAKNDPSSPGGNSRAVLTSTAQGPAGAKKVVVAYLNRSGWGGLGAINFVEATTSSAEVEFKGDNFAIDGNDYCNAAPASPGITTTDSALTTQITNTLTSTQQPKVTGTGGTPSVTTTSPLPLTLDQIITNYLAYSHTTLSGGNIDTDATWGTAANPQITYVTNDIDIRANVEGYGVLILEKDVEISSLGNFTWHGLIIAKDEFEIDNSGLASVYGSLLLGGAGTHDTEFELEVEGSSGTSVFRYDSCALAATEIWGGLPRPAKIIAWHESF